MYYYLCRKKFHPRTFSIVWFSGLSTLSASYRKGKKVLNLYSTKDIHLKAYLFSMAFSRRASPPTELAFFLAALGPRYSNDWLLAEVKWTRMTQNITDTAMKRSPVRGDTTGDNSIADRVTLSLKLELLKFRAQRKQRNLFRSTTRNLLMLCWYHWIMIHRKINENFFASLT